MMGDMGSFEKYVESEICFELQFIGHRPINCK
jgi:hypothetical protein